MTMEVTKSTGNYTSKDIMKGDSFVQGLGSLLVGGEKVAVWTFDEKGAVKELHSRGGLVTVPSGINGSIPKGYLLQQDLIWVVLKDNDSDEKSVLVPGFGTYGLIKDAKRINAVKKIFGERLEDTGRIFADSGNSFLYKIEKLVVSNDELKQNIRLFLQDEHSWRPLMVVDSIKGLLATAWFAKSETVETVSTNLATTKIGELFALTMA